MQYTQHAEEQMDERNIERALVQDVVRSPDCIQKLGKKVWITKKINSHTLKVVYVKEKTIKIVTAYFL